MIMKIKRYVFRYSLKLMEEFAQKMDQEEINTVYCFGDNPLSDIYGANLFTETLEKVPYFHHQVSMDGFRPAVHFRDVVGVRRGLIRISTRTPKSLRCEQNLTEILGEIGRKSGHNYSQLS